METTIDLSRWTGMEPEIREFLSKPQPRQMSFYFNTTGKLARVISVALGALFIGLGNYLPRMRQNYTFGIRTPWALADESNWNRTQRFGGAVFMVMGALIAIAGIIGFLLPINDGVMTGLIVAIALLGTLAVCGYSYLLFRGKRNRNA